MTYTVSQTPKSLNHYIYPNANHAVNLTPSAGDNYACVDEVWNNPNDDTDYVYTSSTSNVTDVYGCPNPSLSGTINYVRLIARAKAHDHAQEAAGNYKMSCYDGTTAEYSANFGPLTDAYTKYYQVWPTKPSGGAWTWADINNLRIGIQCNSPTVTYPVDTVFLPNAAGTITQLTSCVSTSPSAGTNYTFVDDGPTHDEWLTTVRGVDTTFDYDSYNIPNHTTESGVINHVWIMGRCNFTPYVGTPYPEAYSRIRVNGTYYNGRRTFVNTSSWAVHVNYQWTVSPDTSAAWTWSEIDGMEIGIGLEKVNNQYAHCTNLYAIVNWTFVANPPIRTTQIYAVVNYTPSASVVTLNDPKNVDVAHSRNLQRKNLPSGNYIVYDAGRNAKTLTLIGTETSGAYSDMNDMKTICHYGAKVTVAGLDDTNFNTDYWVSDIQFSAGPGYPANMYDYTLTLEEL